MPKYGGEGGPATMGEYKGWRDQELEGGGRKWLRTKIVISIKRDTGIISFDEQKYFTLDFNEKYKTMQKMAKKCGIKLGGKC